MKLRPELAEKFRDGRGGRPTGVVVQARIDASEFFKELRRFVDAMRCELSRSEARALISKIQTWQDRQSKATREAVFYADACIEAVRDLLLSVGKIFFREAPSPSDKKKRKKRGASNELQFLGSSTDVMVAFCGKAEHPWSWRHSLVYVVSACSAARVAVSDFVSAASSERFRSRIQQGIAEGLQGALERGDSEQATKVWESAIAYDPLKASVGKQLSEFFEKKGAGLPSSSQAWVVSILSTSVPTAHIEYANPAESPEMRHAASLLVFLWEHLSDSITSREVFERYRTLCERHFRLFLRGEAGTEVPYDPRFHEATEPRSGPVTLVRPWVEWHSPPNSRVVVRGFVRPIRNQVQS